MNNIFLPFFLKARRKIKIVTLLASLVLIVLVASILIMKNPRSSKATGLFCNGNIAGNYVNDCADGSEVIIDGVRATISGKHKFKSLTIRNGGILEHAAVEITDIVNPAADPLSLDPEVYLSAAALEKKVDLEVEGSVILETSNPMKISRIDVSGKGYPGGKAYSINGYFWNAESGYGPGRGHWSDAWGSWENSIAGGGGFGGRGGGQDDWYRGLTYPTPFSTSQFLPNLFYFGSGAAGRYHLGVGNCDSNGEKGGAGGGRIYIKAGKINIDANSQIVSNGGTGSEYEWKEAGAWNICYDHGPDISGGGSGGLIWLETNQFNSLNTDGAFVAGNNSGEIGSVFSDFNSSKGIFANGGSGQFGGGGGRIVVKKLEDFYIKKELIPINRGGSDQFNPYALQKGDEIEVKLTLTGLQAGKEYTVKDEFLATGDNLYKCAQPTSFFTDPQNNPPDVMVSITALDEVVVQIKSKDFQPTMSITYNCKVQ